MNKAFIKSVEAVLAIILFFSAYSILGAHKNDSIPINPSGEASSLLSALSQNEEFNNYVKEENIGHKG